MKVTEIVDGILNTKSYEDLQSIGRALNLRLKVIQGLEAQKFSVGDPVEFVGKGEYYIGKVTKINPKTVGVLTDCGMKWRVSPTLLTKVK